MIWTAEVHDGATFWRAELVRYGEPLALVVAPSAGRWTARCGCGSTRDLAEHGDLLTVEADVERAKRCAAGWAEGI